MKIVDRYFLGRAQPCFEIGSSWFTFERLSQFYHIRRELGKEFFPDSPWTYQFFAYRLQIEVCIRFNHLVNFPPSVKE